jgi:glyoxylase-like metal-dependent hydrolase (beta-lactamase superfamily II)
MFAIENISQGVAIIRLETWVSRAFSYRTFVPYIDGFLIDSGFSRAGSSLAKALAGKEVNGVVNTHFHEDHIGNNQALATGFGAEIFAPAESIPVLAHVDQVRYHGYQRLVWGVPERSTAKPLGGEITTARHRLEVLPTPGHSPEHVCLFERERGWLFSGDLFLSVKVRLARGFENANDLLTSLRRVRDLAPKYLFCYHRGVVKDPLPALRRKIEFMEGLKDKIDDLHRQGVEDEQIALRLLGRDPWLYRVLSREDFSKLNLVRSFLKAPGTGYESRELDVARRFCVDGGGGCGSV